MKKLTVNDWLHRYEQTSAAKKTAIVYTLEKRVYMSLVDSLEGLPVTSFSRVDKSGAEYDILRLDLKQIDLLHLRDKGAALLGWDDADAGAVAADLIQRSITDKRQKLARLIMKVVTQ